MQINNNNGNFPVNYPEELYDQIFNKLLAKDIGQVAQVSKYWNVLSKTNALWEDVLERDYSKCSVRKDSDVSAQTFYKNHSELHKTPATTENNLGDIIRWLKKGDYVVIYDVFSGRFFHKCEKKDLNAEQIDKSLKNCRVTYVNVNRMPGLLDDGEWNWYIKEAGMDQCTCNLKDRLSDPNGIPHQYMMRL